MDWTQTLLVILCAMSAIMIILVISMLWTLSTHTKKSKSADKNVAIGATNETSLMSNTKSGGSFPKADDLELIAVITAAIAATLGTSADRLVVTSFKQLGTKTHWYAK